MAAVSLSRYSLAPRPLPFVLGRKYSYYTESDVLTNSNIQVTSQIHTELKNTDSCHECQRVTLTNLDKTLLL